MSSTKKTTKAPAVAAGASLTPERAAFQARRDAELARQREGRGPSVYYEPTYGANGHLEGGKFVPHGVPPGFALDVEAWEAAGSSGPAPLVEIAAAGDTPAPEAEVTDGGA